MVHGWCLPSFPLVGSTSLYYDLYNQGDQMQNISPVDFGVCEDANEKEEGAE